jgi:hypothetical protein
MVGLSQDSVYRKKREMYSYVFRGTQTRDFLNRKTPYIHTLLLLWHKVVIV